MRLFVKSILDFICFYRDAFLSNIIGVIWMAFWAVWILLEFWKKDAPPLRLKTLYRLTPLETLKQHITFKIVALAILLAILTPSVVKMLHLFENHQHEVCLGEQKVHFHNLDLDCEFYKFKLNNTFTFSFNNVKIILFSNIIKPIRSQYNFTSDYQRLSFSLRGPPQLV